MISNPPPSLSNQILRLTTSVRDPRRFRVRIGTSSSSSPPPSPAYSTVLSCSSSMKFEGVSEEMKKMVSSANLDQAPERRRIREAFKDVQLEIDHYLFKAQYAELKITESYEINSRGLKIFTKSWLPVNCTIKALVCFCHGYGDTCTFFFEGIAKKLASSGFGVYAMDYPGFGLSDGLHGYITSFDTVVDDVIEHYSNIKEKPEYQGVPSFLFGQSMGGAVALKIHFKKPHNWDGAILVAPMCKMSEDIVPPWPLLQILIAIAWILPEQKLVPQKDLADLAFRESRKREQCSFNVIAYKDKPRLNTALELFQTTKEIEEQLKDVSLPLLILHGEKDTVTDPSSSKTLFDKASSSDKKFMLYKDSYHSLLEGEPDHVISQVFNDITNWLIDHSSKKSLQ
ncbi:Alpha/beta-Hydrolases superfamily protein [Zostera marina]|uniref:Alpha/beta-Hydrolases superfamily protein n=1 Tax=Zostera marina TaxID=29655 RepID=A0A0K9NHC3_ZOSMR|nr:Alpha/beta-Hydrolases superfamily protein [Zostera marina]